MKLCSAVLVLFTLVAVRVAARPPIDQDAASSKVVLRLLNGKNGKPLRNEYPSVWLGNASYINPKTDANGEIALDISRVQPRTVRVFGNYYVDCRPRGSDKQTPMNVSYSLDEIVATGIVTENDCGKYHVGPIPGVLVLYLRPMTFKEKWEL
jgi:hypothetical protein